jgi:CRISPR-associated protein Cas5t
MLLSLVGEENRWAHRGAEVALAMVSQPAVSTVIRTAWRLKTSAPPGTAANKRPDYQQLLTDVRLALWVRPGAEESATPSLAERVRGVVDGETEPTRYGALSLGESTHLVDELRRWRASDGDRGRVLRADQMGALALPVWVDHVGSASTRWMQFRLTEQEISAEPPTDAWATILPPEGAHGRG